MSLKEKYEYYRDIFYLDNPEDKKRLIELLLIVGSLVVAFKTPDDLIGRSIAIKGSTITWSFMVFALFSILYFILIQAKIKDHVKKIELINKSSFVVSIFFSVIMASILALSTAKDITIQLIEAGAYLLIFFIYWLTFTFILWAALREKKPQA